MAKSGQEMAKRWLDGQKCQEMNDYLNKVKSRADNNFPAIKNILDS